MAFPDKKDYQLVYDRERSCRNFNQCFQVVECTHQPDGPVSELFGEVSEAVGRSGFRADAEQIMQAPYRHGLPWKGTKTGYVQSAYSINPHQTFLHTHTMVACMVLVITYPLISSKQNNV